MSEIPEVTEPKVDEPEVPDPGVTEPGVDEPEVETDADVGEETPVEGGESG